LIGDESASYRLAEEGYDVWLGNIRGTSYSHRHVNMSADESAFWDFSWDEMGRYDAPAMVDYILGATGQEGLYWVGHSMGTTMFWVMANERPEYNGKVRLMQALAPVARKSHAKFLQAKLAPHADLMFRLVGGDGAFPPPSSPSALDQLCGPKPWENNVCREMYTGLLALVVGANWAHLDKTQLPFFMTHFPDFTSTRTLYHYAQECNSKLFTRFDYGTSGNQAHYGQDTPPAYAPEAVTCPVALFWSDSDVLVDPDDVAWLAKRLPNLVDNVRVALSDFTHVDFTFAVDADRLVYDRVIENLQRY